MRTNLKLYRTARNMTQEEIATRIGCSRATYSAIEKGARAGRQTFWHGLQNAFEIPDAELWGLTKYETRKKDN